jgi:PPOX class probable FMN-dependent enzyme
MTASDGRIETIEQLRALYREPSPLVQAKVRPELDKASIAFITGAPFALLATTGADGRVDVSPRGGPRGFITVFDDGTIGIPDLNGNNLLDSLRNIVTTGRAALLFVHPGRDETLRVNGRAFITVDDNVLASFTAELRRPKAAVMVEPDEVFVHCAKAFRRGGVWEPTTWQHEGPDMVDIVLCQFDLGGDPGEMRQLFEQGYAEELAEDRPV